MYGTLFGVPPYRYNGLIEVGITIYRTFKDGASIERYTLFVQEDGIWKHRFAAEENVNFQPGVP